MKSFEIENIEINLLLEAIFQRYGHDFRCYARASIERRVRQFLPESGCETISGMIQKLMRDETFFEKIIKTFSITVTEMFRDPEVYRSIRKNVVPVLKTYPFIKIWITGCATGEEAYSLAILLQEEGLYDRATIFATDFNDASLDKAREGIYPLSSAKQFTTNYQQAGGHSSFSEYYHAKYESMAINKSLKKRITFANHNLVVDGIFGEMHLILCRNVLIYFGKPLQDRVLNLFFESLVPGGILCLGNKESLLFSDVKERFEIIDDKMKLYKNKPYLGRKG